MEGNAQRKKIEGLRLTNNIQKNAIKFYKYWLSEYECLTHKIDGDVIANRCEIKRLEGEVDNLRREINTLSSLILPKSKKRKKGKEEIKDNAEKNAGEQDRLILRISECEQVIHDLENNKAWQIVQKDMDEGRRQIDSNWQTIWDNDKLLAARVLKFAYDHILGLREQYREESKQSKALLKKLEHPETDIVKDYDNE